MVGRGQAGVAPEAGNRAGEEVASSEAHRTLCQSGSRSEERVKSVLDASLVHAITMMPHILTAMVVTVYFLPFIPSVHTCVCRWVHMCVAACAYACVC